MSAFVLLWLGQQVPALTLWILLGVAAVSYRSRPWLAAVCALGGIGLGGWLGSEILSVASGDLMSWSGLWEPGARWVLLAALLAAGRAATVDFSFRSVLGAVGLLLTTGPVAAVVALGTGLFEQSRWVELWVAIAAFGLRAWLAVPGYGLLRTVIGWSGLSVDGTTLVSALVIGGIELIGWATVLLWARASRGAWGR